MKDILSSEQNPKAPIYRMLVLRMSADIKSGHMPFGSRLPTVRELSKRLNVAQGTVKRTYDELEAEGLIKKTQGRGTFVCYTPEKQINRKEKAMEAIDRALSEMESMGFSLTEINIFLNLKLRELAAHREKIKVALVESSSEILDQMSRRLKQMDSIDIYSVLVTDMRSQPYSLNDDMDIIVTTQNHVEAVEEIVEDKKKLTKIALLLSSKTVKQIVKLEPGAKVAVLCAGPSFGNLISTDCRAFTENVELSAPKLFSSSYDTDAFLEDKNAVLMPDNYEKYCSADILRSLQRFASKGKIIPCHYHIDEGSFMYLEERIDRLLEKKSI